MDAAAEVKSRLNIEDVIAEYVQLKRAGRNFKGLSPFTHEKTASFVVSPEKQIWHDFSSGKGGDVFTFIQAVEGLDFKGSLELLARKAGVDLEQFRQATNPTRKSNTQTKDRLYAVLEAAVKFYQVQLTQHETALRYLRQQRGYEKQTLLDFRFGYSPADGTALVRYLTAKGFSTEEMKKTGLTSSNTREARDMFRGRIMIPLCDPQGRPVGFTARQLQDDPKSPKYINTPATILYDKSRHVFGLSQAKEAIRKNGYVVVVEGNLDVVASHQAGVAHVVASAGTALTSYHLKALQRFTSDVRLCFDSDRAGQEAAERAIALAQDTGVEMSMVRLTAGKDPDELIQRDPESWQVAVGQSQYMVDWLIERIEAQLDLATAQGKRVFITRILEIIRRLREPVEQEHYLRLVAEKTRTSLETIQAKLTQPAQTTRLKRVATPNAEPTLLRERRVQEQHLLAIAMKYKKAGQLLARLPLEVFSEEARETAAYIQAHPGVSPNDQEYATMISLLFEEQYQQTSEEELVYQAKHLMSRLVNTYAKYTKQTLITEMEKADEITQATLLKAVKQLDDLVLQVVQDSSPAV